MKRMALVAIAALAAACGGGGHTITGALILHDADAVTTGSSCSGSGGYSDIHDGTTVVIKDGSGTVIGTGSLTYDNGAPAGACKFIYSAPVKDADFYSVEVSQRGALTFSKADLEANGWEANAELGTP